MSKVKWVRSQIGHSRLEIGLVKASFDTGWVERGSDDEYGMRGGGYGDYGI